MKFLSEVHGRPNTMPLSKFSKCESSNYGTEEAPRLTSECHRELLDLLGQFLGVVAALDSNWTKALLHRSQLSNSRFLGELLTTFQLISTALGVCFFPL